MKRKAVTAGIAVLVVGVGGAGVATALGSGNDSGSAANDPGAGKAKAAALEITGGGKANQVERDNENGATWEVEVTKPDGNTVDVRLDGSFKKVAVESDSENKNDGQTGEHGGNDKAEHGAESND
jgi:hypothetical protein